MRLVFLQLLLVFPAWAATWYTADDSWSNVNAAYTAAIGGDVIIVGQGTNTWTSGIADTKGVVFASTNRATTVINQGSSALCFALQSGTNFDAVYGFTFNEYSGGASFGVVYMAGYGTTNWMSRVASNTFNFTSKAVLVAGNNYSVIDHNTFVKSVNASANALYLDGTTQDSTNSWSYGPQYGTTNKTYIEDNVFDYSQYPGANGLMDCYAGVRFVLRRNTITNTWLEAHGADSTPNKLAMHDCEVYGNTWWVTSSIPFIAQIRGGTGLIWSNAVNTLDGSSAGSVQITVFRVNTNSPSAWGYVTGSNAIDGNTDSGGYPAFCQPGRTGPTIYNAGSTVQALSMVYGWSNTVNGTLTPEIANGTSANNAGGDSESQLMINGRDYTNAAMAGYVPLAYPHPLVNPGGGGTSSFNWTSGNSTLGNGTQ